MQGEKKPKKSLSKAEEVKKNKGRQGKANYNELRRQSKRLQNDKERVPTKEETNLNLDQINKLLPLVVYCGRLESELALVYNHFKNENVNVGFSNSCVGKLKLVQTMIFNPHPLRIEIFMKIFMKFRISLD